MNVHSTEKRSTPRPAGAEEIAHAMGAMDGKEILKFAPRWRDSACAGEFEIRKLFPQRLGARGGGGMDGVSPEGAVRIWPRVKP